ncbi:O-antigen ligase family protein [Neobacillus niacini]|uniref:O-antigen ligase family protein n=1 Tax=Neobacillus niacini TaxID=86668 RepID=UPI00203FD880|nr:O-antigen ligase family protein [Neobacillus niacini]MCM3693176.1 O-antigen ligase family protein [Neobacillus niacini]
MSIFQKKIGLNMIAVIITIILVSTLSLLGVFKSNIISLALFGAILFILLYLAANKKVFWCYLLIIPLVPTYFAFNLSDSLPLLSAYRMLLLVLVIDQLILKKRTPLLVKTISKDKFAPIITIYSLGIFFIGLYHFISKSNTTAFVGTIAILFEYVLLYYIVLMNINLIIKKKGKSETLKGILKILCISAFILAIFGIIERLISFNLFTLLDISQRAGIGATTHVRMGELRVSTSFIHSLGYGLYLLLMIPIVFYQVTIYKETKGKQYYFNLILLLLLFVNILFTNSRSTLLALAASMLIFFFLSNFKKKIISLYLVILIGIPIIGLSLTPFAEKIPVISSISGNVKSLSDTLLGTSYVENYGSNEEPFTYRKQLITFAFSQTGYENIAGKGIGFIRKEPLVFYLPEINPYGLTVSYSVDNYYVNVKLELGWVGLILTISLFLVFLVSIFKNRNNSFFNKILLVSLSGYLFELTMVGELDTLKYIWIIFAVFTAFSVYPQNYDKQSISPQ